MCCVCYAYAGTSQRMWTAPAELPDAGKILTHIIESYSGLAGQGFDFDQYRVPSPPVNASNVRARAAVFLKLAKKWAQYHANTSQGTLMLPWGGDFRWQNGT